MAASVAENEIVSARGRGALGVVRDLVSLTKPRITFIVLVTAAAGMRLAIDHALPQLPGLHRPTAATWAWCMVGTALVVGAANALNMYGERDVDGLMSRTKRRPLPAGRLSPRLALAFGLLLSVLSLPALTFGVNAMTGLLGAIALVSYVLVYTPMKRVSTWALWVGAVPGAIPPLLGYTAVTGRLDVVGVALFAILFLWQIPHFLAISIFRAEEYARAGLQVVPMVKGQEATDRLVLGYTLLLVGSSLAPIAFGVGHAVYAGIAAVLGVAFVVLAQRGAATRASGPLARHRWARSVFAYSIVYLVVLLAVLVALG